MANQEILQQALEIARAQAGVRPMTAAEIATYVAEVAQALESALFEEETPPPAPAVDPRRSIGETSVICLECGRKFKVLTLRHLKTHDLSPKEYKAKWGLRKDLPLTSRSLVRMRRRKMKEMRLWERRGQKQTSQFSEE